MMTLAMDGDIHINLVALNCYGYKGNCVYIEKLTKSYDLIHLTETWLTKSENHLLSTYRKEFYIIIQPASRHEFGRPFGGSVLLLRKNIFHEIDTIIQEDYGTVVKTYCKNRLLIIAGVYLQSLSSETTKCIDTYQSQLASITGIINQFSDTADPIILGDFQSCPDKPATPRTAQFNPYSKYLSSFIDENNLLPIDITEGQGPCYSYHHFSLPNKSYIDHVLIPSNLRDYVTKTQILPPDASNTSDHLPVDLSLNRLPGNYEPSSETHFCNSTDFIPNHLWKNLRFTELYRKRVAELVEMNTVKDPDTMISNLHTILQKSADDCFEMFNDSSYNFPSKPWWNDDLRKARKNLQYMFNRWRENDFSRLPSDISYNRFKFARKVFRKLVKQSKHQATIDHYINVEKLKKVRPSNYWKQVNFLKKKQQKLYTINGMTDSTDITSEFKSHFEKLLNTPRLDNINNEQCNEDLQKLLTKLQDSFSDEFYISKSEVTNALNKLSTGKS